MKKFFIILPLLCSILLFSCVRRGAKNITIKGSDTMINLSTAWMKAYTKKYKGIKIQVSGGGSGIGIAALLNGTTDVSQASRPIRDAERMKIMEKYGKEVKEFAVATDAIAVYVHSSNPISEISIEKLKQIYTGKIKNWNELGGFKEPIVVYGRENNSGTYEFFKEHVLGKDDFDSSVQTLPGTANVVNAVTHDKRGIGYGGIGYAGGIKLLKVKKDENSSAYEPTKENAISKKYPLSRYLYFYCVGEPSDAIKEYIRWILSPDGQKICEKIGFYPVK